MTASARPKPQQPPAAWDVVEVMAVDALIATIASAQKGLVTIVQLLDAGLSRAAINWRVRHGRLHPLFRGVYLVGHDVPPPGARELGAVLACGEGAALSHRPEEGVRKARGGRRAQSPP